MTNGLCLSFARELVQLDSSFHEMQGKRNVITFITDSEKDPRVLGFTLMDEQPDVLRAGCSFYTISSSGSKQRCFQRLVVVHELHVCFPNHHRFAVAVPVELKNT